MIVDPAAEFQLVLGWPVEGWMSMTARFAFPLALSGLLVICCGRSTNSQIEYTAILADGSYRAKFGGGYDPADEPSLLAITAHLDNAGKELVFYLADGSQQTATFSSRPRSQWQKDCYTIASHSLDEVADLSPAPLQLVKSLTFNSPLAFAKCAPERMIITDDYSDGSKFIAFDFYGP